MNGERFTLFYIGAIALGAIMGWAGTNAYQSINYQREYNGLWMEQNYTHAEALQKSNAYDTAGHWICVNIRGMNIEDMETTIKHEIGHELFAQSCEKNTTKCWERLK